LWRGDAYEVVGHTMAAAAATAKITELREQLVERRVDALLAVGDVSGALADLQVLTTQHPFRERLWAQLMIALARSGRIEEALQTFRRVRSLMRSEPGVEPGAELQRLHMQILAQETEREPDARRARASGPPASTGVRVPRPTSLLVGREYEVAGLQSWLTSKPLVTITGPGGSGKTRLAIEVALGSVKRFPDGVWFVDLTTVTDSHLVVDAITSTLGLVVGDRAPLETIVDYVRARQLLLVIDNCEHVLEGVAETAEALQSDGGGSVLLTTRREPLDVGTEAIWELAPLPLQADTADPGAPPAATQLFVARMAGPPGPDELPLIGQICEAVDGLPLAIELAAARTRWFSLAEILQQVTDDPSRLTRIGRGPADHRTTLWNAIGWSHQLLTATEQTIHRRLSVLPGPLLLLMADKVDCESGLPTRDFAVTAARAEELYERGKSIGNLLVQWEACGMRQIVCVLSDDPATGIIWVDRLIATYLPLGDGGGGAFLEPLANFAALTGDAETAIPLYAASQVDARRSGLYWPIQLQSDTLLERMRQQTAPEHFGEPWTDGERLTLEDVARSQGLTETTR